MPEGFLQRRHSGTDVVDVAPHRLAVEGELVHGRDLQMRKVFSAVFVTSAAVAVIGMTMPVVMT